MPTLDDAITVIRTGNAERGREILEEIRKGPLMSEKYHLCFQLLMQCIAMNRLLFPYK